MYRFKALSIKALNLGLAYLLLSASLNAIEMRRDYAVIRNHFNSGQIDNVADLLLRLRPSTDEERAFVLHYGALLKSSVEEAKSLHIQNSNRYSATYHGQLSMLEMAKALVLEHNLEEARSTLRRITHPEIPERLYWQGVCALHMDQYADAASFSESYLRTETKYIERAHYVLAEAQSKQSRHQNAVTTLNRLKSISGYPSNEQYFYYRLGEAHERASNSREALDNYRRAYEIDKYSQIAYQVEDRLFIMRSRQNSLDISWLYPYTDLGEIAVPPTTAATPSPSLPPQTSSGPTKVAARPNSGYYLQAGRFSVEANAISRATEISTKTLPAIYFEEMQGGRVTWVVMSGPYESASASEAARVALIASNIDCFAIRF